MAIEIDTTTAPEDAPFPWDDRPDKPSAVYAASDRIQSSMFLRSDTPVDTFDRLEERIGRVAGLRLGDLTIQVSLMPDDEMVRALDRVLDAVLTLRLAAYDRANPA